MRTVLFLVFFFSVGGPFPRTAAHYLLLYDNERHGETRHTECTLDVFFEGCARRDLSGATHGDASARAR